jgi:glutamate racemase
LGTSVPIGVFDSGVGGLSVLRHIRACLPQSDLLYFADSAYAPYGVRSEAEIIGRVVAIADFLVSQRAGALVVACNTATAAAIAALRARYPALPIVGVEPGLKPAAALSRTRTVGVLATERTLASTRFRLLREQVEAASGVRVVAQACSGLADQIERGELRSPATSRLLQGFLTPLLQENADTLVLGCTHYPFVRPLIEDIAGRLRRSPVMLVDTGDPVARQLTRLLGAEAAMGNGIVHGYTTGTESSLRHAFSVLLQWDVPVTALDAG